MATCNYDWDNPPEEIGTYMACMLGNLWNVLTIVLVAATVILISVLIIRTLLNRENAKELPNIRKQWLYVFLLAIVAIGGFGGMLNLIFAFLGLPSIEAWLDVLNDFFAKF